jgi:competence protein ComEA
VSDQFPTHRDQPAGAGRRLIRILDLTGPGDQTGRGLDDPRPADLEPGGEPTGSGNAVARLGAAAFDPGRPGVRVLAAVAVVVVAGAAVLAWWSRPRAEPVVPQLAVAAQPVVTPTAAAELVVAVSGQVREPGLVRLAPGARVADAVEAAGGPLPDADLQYLNLARKVADGELVTVGLPPPPGEAAEVPGPGGKVNLNTATQAELETLPGVGPALSQRIIDHRESHGQFRSVEQLKEVSGIGEVRFAELRDLVTV